MTTSATRTTDGKGNTVVTTTLPDGTAGKTITGKRTSLPLVVMYRGATRWAVDGMAAKNRGNVPHMNETIYVEVK